MYFYFKKKKLEKGITIIEILIVVFIIALFSSILIADFPKIKRQFALTRAVHKMSQDLRRAQDMGFSGQQIEGIDVKGYGVYINLDNDRLGNKKYIIYADMDDNQQYTEIVEVACGEQEESNKDCVIEIVNLGETEAGVTIDRIENTIDFQTVDINFRPPNPITTITGLLLHINRVQIIFTTKDGKERIVLVNTSGLIEIK